MAKHLELIDSFPFKVKARDENKELVLSDSGAVKDKTSLICDIAATHAGTLINNRVYPPERMKKGIKTWTTPYKKPVLVNHNEDGPPIGRVMKAKYLKTPRGLEEKDYKPVLKPSDGYGYVDLTVKITDEDAIQKILDGRYETVSVRMSTDHAFCSICNTDWADEGPCDHMPGKQYDKKLAYIVTGDLSYREVSFVNIPADEFAAVEGLKLDVGDGRDAEEVEIDVYANNAEDKILCNLNDEDRTNLYDYLKDETDEEEDTIVHLITKSIEAKAQDRKEDQMSKDKELTKDQLKDMEAVQELIQEAKDNANKECEEQLNKLKEDCEKVNKDSNCEEIVKELQTCKEGKDACEKAQVALSKEKDALEKERDQLKDELEKSEGERKTLLDENVELNASIHKIQAERLFDLKKTLGKPDVAEVKTIEDRDKKVDEFAQRSVDSLKDQINDLLIEQAASPGAPKPAQKVENPGVEHEDSGAPKEDKTNNKKEGKSETLDRLFGKKED
jgi:hypothetical protein